jgi:hypothetical protein
MANEQRERWLGWNRWRRRRRRQDPPFVRFQDLDLLMPAPYPMGPPIGYGMQREVIRQLVAALAPGAVDEGTGEVLHNLVNAWADQALAQVDAAHQERQAVADNLIGASAEEVARHRPRYESDLAEVERTARAVAQARARLSGQPLPAEPPSAEVPPAEVPPAEPAVGEPR